MSLDSVYTASKWGNEFHALPHTEALGAGSAGPGKTTVLIYDPMPLIAHEHERAVNPRHPHYFGPGGSKAVVLYLRRTGRSLEQIMDRTKKTFKRIDPGAEWSEGKKCWTFTSGLKYQFGHCRDPGDWQQYLSNEYTQINFDELVEFEQEQYDQIRSRLRYSDPQLHPFLKIRAMSNPQMKQEEGANISTKNPHWVRERFVEPNPSGRMTISETLTRTDGTQEDITRIYLPAKLSDNPDKAFVAQYELTLRSLPPHIRAALLEGDWYVVPGAYYSDVWTRDKVIVRPFRIPLGWKVFRSMDWGFKSPGCILWFAMDPDENIFQIRELNFQYKTADEVAKMTVEAEKAMGMYRRGKSLVTGPADTQLWEERGDAAPGVTKAATFAKHGIEWTKAAKKSRKDNALKFYGRLKGTTDDSGREPGYCVFNTCMETIKTIPSIQADVNRPETPKDGGPDHWHDAVLYGCAHASYGRAGILDKRDDMDNPDRESHAPSRGHDGYGSTY